MKSTSEHHASHHFWKLDCRLLVVDVLSWCMSHRGADRLLLSAQLGHRRSRPFLKEPSVVELIRGRLNARLLHCWLASAWPGIQYAKPEAGLVFEMVLDEDLVSRLAEIEPAISGWRHSHSPALPEDLCAYRAGDSTPVFYSVTHESELWIVAEGEPPFLCDDDEFSTLEESLIVSDHPSFLGRGAREFPLADLSHLVSIR